MNIGDKARLFREARRMLGRGARLGVYDAMRVAPGAFSFPMPWAMTVEASFLETPAAYRAALEQAGFSIERETDRTALALGVGRALRAEAERKGPPPFTVNMLMGPTAPQRWANVSRALDAGLIAPIEMIARAA